MKRSNVTDWAIVQKEPGKPYLTDMLFESDNADFAFYFSQIEEWSLMKYCSKLQIFSNKSAPQKIYDSASVWFLFDIDDDYRFFYDWTSENLVCLRQLINGGNNDYYFPFIIIDLKNLKYVTVITNFLRLTKMDFNTIEGVQIIVEKKTGKEIEMREIINLDQMNWMPLNTFR